MAFWQTRIGDGNTLRTYQSFKITPQPL